MAMAIPDKTRPAAARGLLDVVLIALSPTINPQIDTGRKIRSKLRTPAISATVSGSCRLLVFRAVGVWNAGYTGLDDREAELAATLGIEAVLTGFAEAPSTNVGPDFVPPPDRVPGTGLI
jgi:hypothetical protein